MIPLVIDQNNRTATSWGLTVADLDSDGKQDVAVAGDYEYLPHQFKPQIHIVWAAGDAVLQRHEIIKVETVAPNVGLGNGTEVVAANVRVPAIPGRLDLLMAMEVDANPNVFALINEGLDGNGHTLWTAVASAATGSWGIDYGKLRNNLPGGGRDAVISDAGYDPDNAANVLFGAPPPPGRFVIQTPLPPYDVTPGSSPLGLQIGKLDSDTKNDVVLACNIGGPPGANGCIAVLQGKGDGTFWLPARTFDINPPESYSSFPRFVKIAQMDGQGFNDVVATSDKCAGVVIFINKNLVP